MMDEGYIKYRCEWELGPPLPTVEVANLQHWRQRLYDLGLIGHYADLGVGYGNISCACAPERGLFVISGTQTGHLAALGPEHFTVVKTYDLAVNSLHCVGPVRASSEALTHAAVYALDPAYRAVIHVHHLRAWKGLLSEVPTTSGSVPYGTPEMALEVQRLYRESNLKETQFFAMAGHREGLVSFGRDLEEAGAVLDKQIAIWLSGGSH